MLSSGQPLSRTGLGSALAGQSMIRPSQSRFRRTMIASLMLTSLVDAFSILVIFLIMSHSASQDVVNVGEKIVLPQATESQIIQDGVVVRIENNSFVVEDQPVKLGALIAKLKDLRANGSTDGKREGIVIVADRNLDYADLSPVIMAGSQAGFTKFKFAVLRKD